MDEKRLEGWEAFAPELVAEVRRLNRVVAELKAEFGTITKNAVLTERERVDRLLARLADAACDLRPVNPEHAADLDLVIEEESK